MIRDHSFLQQIFPDSASQPEPAFQIPQLTMARISHLVISFLRPPKPFEMCSINRSWHIQQSVYQINWQFQIKSIFLIGGPYEILQKRRNSAETGEFCCSAQNSAFHRKLWSLVETFSEDRLGAHWHLNMKTNSSDLLYIQTVMQCTKFHRK